MCFPSFTELLWASSHSIRFPWLKCRRISPNIAKKELLKGQTHRIDSWVSLTISPEWEFRGRRLQTHASFVEFSNLICSPRPCGLTLHCLVVADQDRIQIHHLSKPRRAEYSMSGTKRCSSHFKTFRKAESIPGVFLRVKFRSHL